MRIQKEETLAVVIDIQERLLPHIYQWEGTLHNCTRIIEGFQILSVPVIVTQQYTKGLGGTDSSIAERISPFSYIEKTAFSCFGEPAFKDRLSSSGKKNIILIGIEAHVCVLLTCLDLLASGYIPFIPEDCVSSRKLQDKAVAIERMRQEGARITTIESILFELTQCAGTEVFRNISRLVK